MTFSPHHPDNPWTDERIELLKKFWADGLSCSQIAGELGGGLTRCAIIGKAHRLQLPQRQEGSGGGRKPRPFGHDGGIAFKVKRGIQQQRKRAPRLPDDCPVRAVVGTGPRPPSAEDLAIPIEQRATIVDLRDDVCRWPVGDPAQEGFFFCGGAAESGKPYCAHHCARAFNFEPPARGVRARFSRHGTRLPTFNVVAAG